MKKRVTEITVGPENQPLFSEMMTRVAIADEGGGEFIEIRQPGRADALVQIEAAEWPELRDAINQMIDECRGPNREAV